jgi:hypothetical protein
MRRRFCERGRALLEANDTASDGVIRGDLKVRRTSYGLSGASPRSGSTARVLSSFVYVTFTCWAAGRGVLARAWGMTHADLSNEHR